MSQSACDAGRAGSVSRQYAPYNQAEGGFGNHWCPAAFSHEVEERGVVGVTIGGHAIAIRRVSSGDTLAIAGRCIHRGVKLSRQPTCADKKNASRSSGRVTPRSTVRSVTPPRYPQGDPC